MLGVPALPYFLILYLGLQSLGNTVEQFDEELSINPLQDGRVGSKFSFRTVLKGSSPRDPRTLGKEDESQHYTLFPLALGQILREYGVSELHLTLNAGKWDYNRWGYPEERSVGSGAELWAWFGDGSAISIDHRWRGLRNALAGLFCASLGSLDEKRTTSPERSFIPEGALPDWGVQHYLRHATLPSEHVCTENLTPFLKLLPCKSLSGIASLLNPHRLFDADWHGMGVHVSWNPDAGVEMRMVFQSVSDPLRLLGGKKRDWSFQALFDRTIDRSCPVAQTSRILVTLPSKGSPVIMPEPTSLDKSTAIFDLNSVEKPINVAMQWPTDFEHAFQHDLVLPSLSIQRNLVGSSQARGSLSLVFKNRTPITRDVLYLETMPWLVQFYLHTLKTHVNRELRLDILSNITYIPAVPHSRPSTFQATLRLPPNSTVHLTMDVTKAFLRYTEHPPDAQRGWDLPPAIIIPLKNSTRGSPEPSFDDRFYTSGLLVDLATPDFSMPYNVIIFSCSLIAFLFGSIFNLLTRKFVIVRMDPSQEN